MLFNLWVHVIRVSHARILKHQKEWRRKKETIQIAKISGQYSGLYIGKFIHIIFQRKSQDTFAINACLLSFGMSTRCKFSAYSGIVKGVNQLQVRHLVLQLKTQSLRELSLCDWCELIVSLSVEYVLELYRVRMKARGFTWKGSPVLPLIRPLQWRYTVSVCLHTECQHYFWSLSSLH